MKGATNVIPAPKLVIAPELAEKFEESAFRDRRPRVHRLHPDTRTRQAGSSVTWSIAGAGVPGSLYNIAGTTTR